MIRPSRPLLALPVVVALGLAGCASPSATVETPAAAAPDAVVSVDNCGTVVDFDAAPERVLTIKSTSTEMLLALGLGDRIVGTAFQDGPVPEEWSAAASGLVSVSDKVPSQEAVLELEPDLVYAGWESNFAADGAGERASLEALGVHSYVSPAACKEPGYKPAKLDFAQIFGEIDEVATIFRTDASPVVDAQQKVLAGIEPLTGDVTALWYSSGTDTPYVGGGTGAPQLLMETVGLRNIAAEVQDTWTSYSWEAIVDANPDVIVLVDATWNTAAKKIELLTSNPATAGLDAVVNKRYLVLPFPASEAGVRSVPAAADLAAQLEKLDLHT
ncbi:putative F420-0 ABC transporter substrate-binding protein [Luethyella okanaganae]|uniref:F420-0 ABC transporter substrate-binding protein n=1 Tax=Luethyella okanaganae TaxID=69372 RepID=A0ABW1VIZ3_9MICO